MDEGWDGSEGGGVTNRIETTAAWGVEGTSGMEGEDSEGVGGRQNIKKKKSGRRIKKSERRTYSIKNHVYFEEDDPFCWPCQLLAFQGVGFAFSILDLWERDMTGVCLAIPGWIGSPGHLWTPAAGADREPKTTVATLTSTCSLPSAARLCQTEINYPGESYCTAEHRYVRHMALSHAIYIFKYKRHFTFFSKSHRSISRSVSFSPLHFLSSHLSISSFFFSASLPFSLLPVISSSLWNNKSLICVVAKITSAFYIFHCMF